MNNNTKICNKCGETKPLDKFSKDRRAKDGKQTTCNQCLKEYREEHREERLKYQRLCYEIERQRIGNQSMYENKSCAQYLGIVIGERLCRHLFKDVEVMPNGFPDYDFICNKGKKINVKTACITFDKGGWHHWQFEIKENKIPDFFILVAFDNRSDLNPLHLWIIPGHEINHRKSKSIRSSTIHKWDKWKQDITKAQLCCAEIKGDD